MDPEEDPKPARLAKDAVVPWDAGVAHPEPDGAGGLAAQDSLTLDELTSLLNELSKDPACVKISHIGISHKKILEDFINKNGKQPPEPDDRNRNTGARLEIPSDDCT